MARKRVYPVAEPSFRDNEQFGSEGFGNLAFIRKFSEHLYGIKLESESGIGHFVVGFNKEDSDPSFLRQVASEADGLKPEEIDIPPGFIVCIGSKGSVNYGGNPVCFPGYPSDAYSIPGTTYSSAGRLNRILVSEDGWVTIMWTGTRWVWMGSNNWY